MEIEKIIESLGLNEKEAKVYIALLQLGTASAYAISLKSGLKRPTTYVILDDLARRGVVFVIPKTKKKLYQATSPDELVRIVEEKIQKVRDALPQIHAIVKTVEKPQVFYLEGIEGIRGAMDYHIKEMRGKELVGFFAKGTEETLKRFENFEEYNKKLKKFGITERGIAPSDKSISHFREVDKEFGREIKILSQEKYSSTITIEIGDSFVKFYDFENLHSLIIENSSITKTMKQVFELIWEKLA